MADSTQTAPSREPTRRERAAATRRRIMDAAYGLFCDRGYTATTMKAVAEAAGVAVQTVYFVFHTKAELLRAVMELTAAGMPDAPPVMQRAWILEALESPDGRRTIALMVEHGVEIYARSALLVRSVRQAALVEPEVHAVWTTISTNRKAGMAQLIASLHRKGALRPDLSLQRATDICHALNSHDLYLDLVVASGWTLPAYKAWLYDTLCRALLTPAAFAAPGADAATRDLSFAPALPTPV
jgi:AcrR family transcriptional regulator